MNNEVARTIKVQLNLASVESGGNTASGRYFYSFTPDLIIVKQSPTTIVFEFSPDTARHYRIEDLVTTDAKFQLSRSLTSDDGRTMTIDNRNTERSLIFISVLVRDTSNDVLINCDPQMINVPVGG
jgi:hypothetical protein